MAEEGELVVKVKTLIGESISISISPSKTIHHLKLLLIQSFSPASISPHFHLFLRGMKLDLQSQIGSHSINPGEFIALMPFTKKQKPQNPDSQEVEAKSQTCHQNMQNLAESTWRDMMDDLSYLNKTSNCEIETGSSSVNISDDVINTSHVNDETLSRSYSSRKRKTPNPNCQEELSEDLIADILKCYGKDLLFEDICTRIFTVLETVRCLTDVKTGNCIMLSKASNQKRGWPPCLCVCPPWLKMMMKVFTFLNILSGCLQFQQDVFTSDHVKDSLDKLQKLGLSASMDDVRHLSVICPKVLLLVEEEPGSELPHDVIVISNFYRRYQNEARECSRIVPRISESKMVACIKKRQTLFKTTLAKAFILLVRKRKYGGDGNVVSLEDLMASMKKTGSLSHVVDPAQMRFSSSNSKSQPTRCNETHALSPLAMLDHLRKGIGSNGQVVHVEEISPRVADFTEIPEALSESTKSSLVTLGINKLYKHQAESIKASLGGRNVVVATMTSSGKSLCYNLPVLEALSRDLLSCALYMFPTKALAQDQLRALSALTERVDHLHIGVYDGDTSEAHRNWLRANARLLITNPDMLHMSILPFHTQFHRILSNLKFVVIDEAHAYKGAFGCHTALILRRLRRLCSHVYGSDPSFVFSTATSANPREHAMELSNLPDVELIDKDGSPSGPKFFVLWNPPLCQEIVHKVETRGKAFNTRRSSPILEISCLLAEMVQHGLRSIAFCKTRKLCELVLSYTREILHDTAPHLVNAICAYRAGYVAEDRRRIERELFSGELCGVAATNALELGIDVGHIDVTLHLGFPGSVSSLWQQAGRSGRRGRPSLAVYVAFDGPLDQYFMKFPKKLFQSPIECCHVDAQNPKVLEQHIMCAAVEHSLSLIYDHEYFGSGLKDAIATLERTGYLSSDPSRDCVARIWSYIGPEKSPHRTISIRAIESIRYKVMDGQTDEVLEEIEESKAFFQIYEGAVYMNQGKTYLVKELSVIDKTAVCQKADLKYYTKTRDYTDIDVIGGLLAYPSRVCNNPFHRTTARTNSCTVTTTWFGFHRIWKGSNTVFDTIDLALPKYSYESQVSTKLSCIHFLQCYKTLLRQIIVCDRPNDMPKTAIDMLRFVKRQGKRKQAVWIQVPQSVKKEVESANFSFRAGLHAASHAILNVVPLYIICDSSDMAPECANPHEKRYFPERILIYDQHPGGTGLSARIRPLFNDLLSAALNMLTSCYCYGETGCPNCAHSLACKEYNELLHKDAAVMIIKGVLEAEESYFKELQAQRPLETT